MDYEFVDHKGLEVTLRKSQDRFSSCSFVSFVVEQFAR